jgi:hypothetical protein
VARAGWQRLMQIAGFVGKLCRGRCGVVID